MKPISITLIGIFTCCVCFAQKTLTNSRVSSYYTYFYKLDDADMHFFYGKRKKGETLNLPKHAIDSVRTDGNKEPVLKPGNYLKVYALLDELHYKLIEIHSAYPQLFDNQKDLRFIVLDTKGSELQNAEVFVDGKKIAYRNSLSLYQKVFSKDTAILKIGYQGSSNFFKIARQKPYRFSWWKQVFFTATPFRQAIHAYRQIFLRDKYSYSVSQESKYAGYVAFNKPEYKPNDTVKFKAYIFKLGGNNPVKNRELLFGLKNDDSLKVLGRVSAYRNGAFEGSFVLKDSLDLLLDQNYTLCFKEPGSKNKNKMLITGSFRYGDYELKSIRFSVRADEKESSRNNPIHIYLKATDENDLPVADGRVTIVVSSQNATNYSAQQVFVPDTLWKHSLKLDAVGETKLGIPDSIFPHADLHYRISATFLNSQNESREQTLYQTFDDDRYRIADSLNNDTLKISYLINGKNTKSVGKLISFNSNNDSISEEVVSFPARLLIKNYQTHYDVETEHEKKRINLSAFPASISVSANRTKDSIFIDVNNPRKIPFWYTLFSNKRIVTSSRATSLNLKSRSPGNGNISFRLNYMWAGKPESDEVSLVYREKRLNLQIEQPVTVYPGQEAPIEITVKDAEGKPVAGADLTAYSLTSKFEGFSGPSLPYFGKRYKARKQKNRIGLKNSQTEGDLQIFWERWSKEMGLDSITYFQFTHPEKIWSEEESAPGNVTQFAPFVVKNGKVESVKIIYLDNMPIFFNQAEQLQRYSFNADSGRHKLGFRTENEFIELKDVQLRNGKKLIMSLNDDSSGNDRAKFRRMPIELTDHEANVLSQYMIRVENKFGRKMASIEQDDHLILLNSNLSPYNRYSYNTNDNLVGPLKPGDAEFKVREGFSLYFTPEPDYLFRFSQGLIHQKSIQSRYPFQTRLLDHIVNQNYKQFALSQKDADTIWHNYLNRFLYLNTVFYAGPPSNYGKGRLQVQLKNYARHNYTGKIDSMIKAVLIYKHDDPSFLQIYSGNSDDFGYLVPGTYKLMYLLFDNRYCIVDEIAVKPNGLNYFKAKIENIKPADEVSSKIAGLLEKKVIDESYSNSEELAIKETFNLKYLDDSGFKNEMQGRVNDEKGVPIPGASITIEGSKYGALTDQNGMFHLKTPEKGILRISFIGYLTKRIAIQTHGNVQVVLEERSDKLNEVVVTGFGTAKQRSGLSYSTAEFNSLEGKVAGIMIRGAGLTQQFTSSSPSSPLYVVDGILQTGAGAPMDPNLIADISVLKGEAAMALYGARAAAGVIVITTKKPRNSNAAPGLDGMTASSGFRSHFSDYGYWRPRLITDQDGIARFKVRFPDDITNWRTEVLAVAGQKTGSSEGTIKAFKPISASVISPSFLIKGDETEVIGKVMNYTSDDVKVTRTFSFNKETVSDKVFTIKNAVIDTFKVFAPDRDSVQLEYSMQKENGFFDGERRTIPVFEQGVPETKGIFAALEKDTTAILKFDQALGPVTFRAEASVLPALTEEAERLRNYEHLCNEQLASKLKGLLTEKRIQNYLKQPFKWDRNVRDVIKKMEENRRAEGTWGWWNDSEEELWISLHAAEALIDAQKEGYEVKLNAQSLIDYLLYRVDSYHENEKLEAIALLQKLGAKTDYKRLISAYEKEMSVLKARKKYSGYNWYPEIYQYQDTRLLQVKQQGGLKINIDSLIQQKKSTMFGNTYWGDNGYHFFDNSIEVSLLVYQIMKADGKHADLLPKIRNYFLEQKREGYWRNTYESSQILETILPDLLDSGKVMQVPSLHLTGGKNENVTQFPYAENLPANATLSLSKKGTLPIYITAYQKFWNKNLAKVSKDFTVSTSFEKAGIAITKLKGGESVDLIAKVRARADADFVMIEIPIPAGCSYETKEQKYFGNESHREYFKNKVCIYCRKLKQGLYTFTVDLMPRFGGTYTLNPAKAEMMYFPVFYGREDLKKVRIN